ncbi:glycosyltransferase family 2 protein [Aeromonas enteropelogenes]|uniref:glycosyltransferase family 2 protein n=1 Tax=Aeromonas enteropelogenes TaxID=29489 RepID=UPI00191F908A|nr:glycosyltransferase family 2 protein [Aeromonas enteropelogenes]MBL0455918.1 glycosyltransferase family 2 protein [Aeromonas enteropelogenes]
MIKELNVLTELNKKFTVLIKDNLCDENLKKYCVKNKLNYIDTEPGLGFGANNNKNFLHCKNVLGMKPCDSFIVLNPDVIIKSDDIDEVVDKVSNGCDLLGINLYKDERFTVYDNSVRYYPTLFSFIKSFIGFGNNTVIDKRNISSDIKVDWFAGSFMAFKSNHYENLNGFDEGYFMYCEDIDICLRSRLIGKNAIYTPDIKAIHKAQHKNRNIFTKHFLWHIKSSLRFLIKKNSVRYKK